ncbi:hypothetical protein CANARDRAFT_28680 [[Candida] arabinofermentans NRRL YB-2248]|uniref:Uncharacterized protein n=1 Tax=[Candida] arabinofermentans NRRL YB-2248 TaxID=983967 RepID=A0A1E4SZK9_9ASCO|nr:hypothetical protein CANARDRAFT_28680 [[Candida] arabinofermentans NRRL YB-2248]
MEFESEIKSAPRISTERPITPTVPEECKSDFSMKIRRKRRRSLRLRRSCPPESDITEGKFTGREKSPSLSSRLKVDLEPYQRSLSFSRSLNDRDQSMDSSVSSVQVLSSLKSLFATRATLSKEELASKSNDSKQNLEIDLSDYVLDGNAETVNTSISSKDVECSAGEKSNVSFEPTFLPSPVYSKSFQAETDGSRDITELDVEPEADEAVAYEDKNDSMSQLKSIMKQSISSSFSTQQLSLLEDSYTDSMELVSKKSVSFKEDLEETADSESSIMDKIRRNRKPRKHQIETLTIRLKASPLSLPPPPPQPIMTATAEKHEPRTQSNKSNANVGGSSSNLEGNTILSLGDLNSLTFEPEHGTPEDDKRKLDELSIIANSMGSARRKSPSLFYPLFFGGSGVKPSRHMRQDKVSTSHKDEPPLQAETPADINSESKVSPGVSTEVSPTFSNISSYLEKNLNKSTNDTTFGARKLGTINDLEIEALNIQQLDLHIKTLKKKKKELQRHLRQERFLSLFRNKGGENSNVLDTNVEYQPESALDNNESPVASVEDPPGVVASGRFLYGFTNWFRRPKQLKEISKGIDNSVDESNHNIPHKKRILVKSDKGVPLGFTDTFWDPENTSDTPPAIQPIAQDSTNENPLIVGYSINEEHHNIYGDRLTTLKTNSMDSGLSISGKLHHHDQPLLLKRQRSRNLDTLLRSPSFKLYSLGTKPNLSNPSLKVLDRLLSLDFEDLKQEVQIDEEKTVGSHSFYSDDFEGDTTRELGYEGDISGHDEMNSKSTNTKVRQTQR